MVPTESVRGCLCLVTTSFEVKRKYLNKILWLYIICLHLLLDAPVTRFLLSVFVFVVLQNKVEYFYGEKLPFNVSGRQQASSYLCFCITLFNK